MAGETLKYVALMLAAGIGVPILAGLNAGLGLRLGNPAAAAVVLFAVAFLTASVVLVFSGSANWAGIATTPKHYFLGGLFVAFYVLSITYVAPNFGVGNAVFFALLGQLISAAAIDHFGLFGAVQSQISLTRAGGIAIMALGVLVAQKA